jgi:hypothetical protein
MLPCSTMVAGTVIRIESSSEMARPQHNEFLKHPSNNLFVYTGGSKIDNHVGAAAMSRCACRSTQCHFGELHGWALFRGEATELSQPA